MYALFIFSQGQSVQLWKNKNKTFTNQQELMKNTYWFAFSSNFELLLPVIIFFTFHAPKIVVYATCELHKTALHKCIKQ